VIVYRRKNTRIDGMIIYAVREARRHRAGSDQSSPIATAISLQKMAKSLSAENMQLQTLNVRFGIFSADKSGA